MIPDFQSVMLPILEILRDEKDHTLKELIKSISDRFNLTEDERNEFLPSGNQPIINNRVGWARTYLAKAGLIKYVQRATFKITPAGIELLKSKPQRINIALLKNLSAFKEWQSSYTNKTDSPAEDFPIDESKTPVEVLELSHQKIKDDLAFELLEKVKSCSPAFFEKLVVDLILKMGYGGSRVDAGEIVGKSGDGGIDGVIKEDKLGLDIIYIQAKRWENSVPIKEIRDFAGALLGKKARKGIFITTSTFPTSAFEFIKSLEHRIILIDGKELSKLMMEFGVGVSVESTIEIKRIDADYFEEV